MNKLLLMALTWLVAMSGCVVVSNTNTCDNVCTNHSQCDSGQRCLETSTPGTFRCLPSACERCPIGKCRVDLDACTATCEG